MTEPVKVLRWQSNVMTCTTQRWEDKIGKIKLPISTLSQWGAGTEYVKINGKWIPANLFVIIDDD